MAPVGFNVADTSGNSSAGTVHQSLGETNRPEFAFLDGFFSGLVGGMLHVQQGVDVPVKLGFRSTLELSLLYVTGFFCLSGKNSNGTLFFYQ